MKKIYCMVAVGFVLCCLVLPGSAHSGDTRDATGKLAPAGAAGSMGSWGLAGKPPVGATGKTPVGVTGKVPVGAAGNMGPGSVTGTRAPRGIMRRVYTGRTNDRDEQDEDDTE